jgi:hypothetical protein
MNPILRILHPVDYTLRKYFREWDEKELNVFLNYLREVWKEEQDKNAQEVREKSEL